MSNNDNDNGHPQCEVDCDMGMFGSQTFQFDENKAGIKWTAEVEQSKKMMYPKAEMRIKRTKDEPKNWLKAFNSFHEKWGSDCVPNDLRHLVNGVERLIGHEETDFLMLLGFPQICISWSLPPRD